MCVYSSLHMSKVEMSHKIIVNQIISIKVFVLAEQSTWCATVDTVKLALMSNSGAPKMYGYPLAHICQTCLLFWV